MGNARRGAVLLALGLGLGLLTLRALPAQNAKVPTLAEADKLYVEKSYAGALAAYEVLLKAGAVPAPRKDEVQYRVAVSLGKAQQWDRALEAGLEFVKTHRGTVWEPRGLYWLGRLYLGVPHQGWKVGKRVYRGNNVPKTDAAEKPEQVFLHEQDSENALDALEAARVLYPKFRDAQKRLAAAHADEIALNFDLARVLASSSRFHRWMEKRQWAPPTDPQWEVDPTADYDPKWAPPKRVLYLYEQIRSLAGKEHQSALAEFAKAVWLRQYQAQIHGYAFRYENGQAIRIPYPYEALKPTDLLRALIKDFPENAVRDQAQFTIGMWLEEEGQYARALTEYRLLIEERPAAKWVEDAKARIEGIQRTYVTFSNPPTQPPGKSPTVNVSFRNARTLKLELFPFRLAEAVARQEVLADPHTYFMNFERNVGNLAAARRFYGPSLREWDETTSDKGDHQPGQHQLVVPVRDTGAYILEVSAGGYRSATLILLSDLMLVQKVHRDGALFFVTNAATGEPVRDAEVIAKQWWYEPNVGQRSSFKRARANEEGLVTVPLDRAPGRTSFRIGAMAVKGERFALTHPGYTHDVGGNADHLRAYATTDRAVYRPAQTVNYRQALMRRTGGEWEPVRSRQVQLQAVDPQGQRIFETTAVTSEFGTINGFFRLPSETPLGEYYLQLTLPGENTGITQHGGNRFRVEEYKKPEFEVTVTPAAERVRLGEPTSAVVKAEYYFGGPVSNARVEYRVHRNRYYQTYHFPRPFEFLYGLRGGGDRPYGGYGRNGEVVVQGEVRTDEKGEARITFPTKVDAAGWAGADVSFSIEADVQDSSRRTISGSGSVRATKHDVAVFLNYPHGYATEGDRLEVEVVTVNPSNQPVAASGTAKVFRQPSTPDKKEVLVHEEAFKTDAKGRGILKWTARTSGYYRVAFYTRDTAEQEVSGSTFVFVNGPELEQGRFLYRDVSLLIENPYYEEGQTVKALLITPEPNCTVLVTREANNEVLEKQLIRVKGRSLELKLPLAKRDVPNVYFSAVLVRDHRTYMNTQEVFVPPVRQLAKVTVEAEKDRHEPGGKARFRLTARDWQGRPLRTELVVSITDASLDYIQKDYAPDIQSYFYGERRSTSIQNGQSGGITFEGRSEDRQPRGTYQLHGWAMPDGMGMIPDWPGDQGFGYPYRRFRGARGEVFFGAAMPGAGGFGGGGGSGPAGPVAAEARKLSLDAREAEAGNAAGDAGGLRTNFADTALWSPAVVTGADGKASVEVVWPDNLTEWKARAVGHSQTAQVGSGETSVRTRKDLLVRLQAPRFFVERDAVVLSANVHNYQAKDARVKVTLGLGDSTAELAAGGEMREMCPTASASPEVWVDVPKDGEKRVDWVVHVRREGKLTIRMAAQSPGASDATQLSFPVLVHGVERAVTAGGVLRDGNRAEMTINLPAARKPGSSELIVQLNPSLGATMLDALPYLVEYPYGCIEQTVSRFIPAVVVEKTLKDLGYDLAALRERAKLLEEKQREGDAARPGGQKVANSPYTYPKGRPGTLRVADLSTNLRRWRSPVFDPAELRQMVTEGLTRIRAFQHPDGGWGWWPGDSSDPYMSAYVLYGLMTAKDAGYPVDGDVVSRGMEFVKSRFLEDDNLHRMAYQARVLGMDPAYRDAIRPLITGRLFERRERLSAYSKALLATALHQVGDREKAEVMLRNVETTALVDDANGTANWGESADWWRWWNNKVETNAAVLQAYVAIRPEAKLPPMVVKWLVNNQRGNTWNSTRETAMAVYALADYVRANKELAPDYTLTVDLGGRVKRAYQVNRENALFFDNQFIVPDELLETGAQTLTFTKEGPGTLYYTAHTEYFSLEEPIKATGHEIFVKRRYFRLVPGTATGAPQGVRVAEDRPNPFLTGQYELLDAGGEWFGWQDTSDGPRYERRPVESGETLTSGDLIEVELQLESKNDYEYLVFEDLKPAGCEPVEVRSGGKGGLGIYSNMELRDQKVAFFLSYLPQGSRALTYRLRAEIPGRFHVLPTNGYAMYAPDIRCLSDEMSLGVRDP
jgi:uncharacterized protein YfaS (alpha-2-macroglobulin family)/tetratricopeptide (TPR) repeat protein